MQELLVDHNKMERDRAKFEDERLKVYQELHNVQRRLEEEISLRLFFEAKLNSLHFINTEHESKFQLLKEQHEELKVKYSRIDGLYGIAMKEKKELSLLQIHSKGQLAE